MSKLELIYRDVTSSASIMLPLIPVRMLSHDTMNRKLLKLKLYNNDFFRPTMCNTVLHLHKALFSANCPTCKFANC